MSGRCCCFSSIWVKNLWRASAAVLLALQGCRPDWESAGRDAPVPSLYKPEQQPVPLRRHNTTDFTDCQQVWANVDCFVTGWAGNHQRITLKCNILKIKTITKHRRTGLFTEQWRAVVLVISGRTAPLYFNLNTDLISQFRWKHLCERAGWISLIPSVHFSSCEVTASEVSAPRYNGGRRQEFSI